MRVSFGPLQVTIKYTYLRGGTTIYQRAVPTDLRDRYPSATVKKVLKTIEPAKVARLVVELNRKLEAEWAGLRAAPESSPKALTIHADALLKSYGLAPGAPDNHPQAIELLHDHIERKRLRYAGDDAELFFHAGDADFLSPVEVEAGRRLHGKPRDTIEDALALYLETHKQRDDERFATYARRAFATLVAVTGDKELAAFTRADARSYVAASLDKKVKTGTIRRRIGVFTAVWGAYRRERDPQRNDPFERIGIAGDGEDATPRVPYTADHLRTLYSACRTKDDERRWIIALLIDTGARLAEVAGLALDDLKIDAETPHVVIRPHAWRRLKNAASERTVPLVGASLWAAQRVHQEATAGQRFAFPRYTDDKECRATAASAALVGWVRRIPIDRVLHELRHTMADRLREVQCPRPIQFAIDGHASQDVGDSYGDGYSLRVKAQWLTKVALSP